MEQEVSSSTYTSVVTLEEEEDPKQVSTIAQFLNKKLSALEKLLGSETERGENEWGWALLPDVVIERVFELLNIQDRYNGSMVCLQWNRAFHMPRTWRTFTLEDYTLTRRKFNYYSGWQYVLDHLRTQLFIFRVGKYIRSLRLSPMYNLFNLYEFMNMMSYYAERYYADNTDRNSCLFRVETLRFVFCCDIANREEHFVFGTGGKLLEGLKRLMVNMKYLKELELIDLLLDPKEAIHLLDDAANILCQRLQKLTLINATKDQFALFHPACFLNLRILKISPQSLEDEMVAALAHIRTLEEMHIIQNCYSEKAEPVSAKSWMTVHHHFRVYLRTVGRLDKEIVWQEKAPVYSILYDCPLTKVCQESLLTTADLYSDWIQEYGHLGLPKFRRSRRFVNRIDSPLLSLCRRCPYLSTLYVRECLSTSTALLIVGMTPNLRHFHIRRNALILKCDYKSHKVEVDYNFSKWIELNCRSYDKTIKAIRDILLCIDWKPLSDAEFKNLCAQRSAY